MFSRILIEALSTHANKVLVTDRHRSLTGSDVSRLTNQTAARLMALRITPGDRVGICMRDQVSALMVFIALFRVGAVPAFLDFRIKPENKSQLIETFNLVAMLDDGKSVDYHPRAHSFHQIWDDAAAKSDIIVEQPEASSGYMAVSSGTTGLPKAYVISDKTLLGRIHQNVVFEPEVHTKLLIVMPLAYAATHYLILPCLLVGVEVNFFPLLYSTKQLVNTLRDKNISGASLPPAIIYNLLQEVGGVPEPAFPNLKMLKCGGDVLSPENVANAYQKLTHGFEISYGASAIGHVSRLRGSDTLRYPNSAGKTNAKHDVIVEVLDRETLGILPVGQEGILRIRSEFVADEIISNQPTDEETGPGWCILGDIGYVNDEGFVFVTGRLSDTIMRGGISVLPAEVERALKSAQGVEEVAVVGIKDERMGQDVAAMIVAPTLTEDKILQYIMQNIDPDKRPRQIHMVKSLPTTQNGKVDRKTIREMFE